MILACGIHTAVLAPPSFWKISRVPSIGQLLLTDTDPNNEFTGSTAGLSISVLNSKLTDPWVTSGSAISMVTASLHGSSEALPGCGRLDRDDVFLGEGGAPPTWLVKGSLGGYRGHCHEPYFHARSLDEGPSDC